MTDLDPQYQDFYDRALAAGFVDRGPIWGPDPDDNDQSRRLIKDDVVLFLIHRTIWGRSDRRIAGWFENGTQAMAHDLEPGIDLATIEDLRELCTGCERPCTDLVPVPFASRLCPDCLAEAGERRSWS